jgi:hypothetical protein
MEGVLGSGRGFPQAGAKQAVAWMILRIARFPVSLHIHVGGPNAPFFNAVLSLDLILSPYFCGCTVCVETLPFLIATRMPN